jgi:tetratricopeptide (TPR) repeat protein
MTDQPQQAESSNSVTNVSGGVNANAERIDIGADVVGRDKIVHIDRYYAGSEAAPNKLKVYHNLPQPDYVRFVGRENELTWLRERLSPEDRAWQIAITGIGGVGKSALALATADYYLKNYGALPPEERFEAIVWVSAKEKVLTTEGKEDAALPSSILRTLEDVYTAIAQATRREEITHALPQDQDRLVQKALRENRVLLIMDNLESVTDERVKPFLRKLPQPTKAVITSREWLDVADVLPLKGLSQDDAMNLIAEEANVRHLTLDMAQQQRIVDLTSGLPLPIKLSIARMASGESFTAVIRWLGDATGDVPEYCVKGQADLIAQRDSNTWRLLLACSLFDRGAGAAREALGYIADLSVADRDNGLACLQRFYLINRTDKDRFWLLPIVQRYVAVQIDAAESSDSLIEPWTQWLINYVEKYGSESWDWRRYPIIELEIDNIILMIKRNLPLGHLRVLAASRRIAYYMKIRGRWAESIALSLEVLPLAYQLNDYLAISFLSSQSLAWAYGQMRHLDEAERYAHDGLQAARQLNILEETVGALRILGQILRKQGRFAEAQTAYGEGLSIAREHDDEGFVGNFLGELGKLMRDMGHHAEAWELLRQATSTLKHREQDKPLYASLLGHMGAMAYREDDLNLAQSYCEECQQLFEGIGGVTDVSLTLAKVYNAQGHSDKAIEAARQSVERFRKLGMTAELTEAESLFGDLLSGQS